MFYLLFLVCNRHSAPVDTSVVTCFSLSISFFFWSFISYFRCSNRRNISVSLQFFFFSYKFNIFSTFVCVYMWLYDGPMYAVYCVRVILNYFFFFREAETEYQYRVYEYKVYISIYIYVLTFYGSHSADWLWMSADENKICLRNNLWP